MYRLIDTHAHLEETANLEQALTEAKAANVLCASVFHFGEITIPEAKKYLKEKGIPVIE